MKVFKKYRIAVIKNGKATPKELIKCFNATEAKAKARKLYQGQKIEVYRAGGLKKISTLNNLRKVNKK